MPFCSSHVSWLYKLEANYSWQSPFDFAEDVAFQDKAGKVRLILQQGGRITVTRGYAWNGCSPKCCLFDLIVGTPDGVVDPRTGHPKTWCASVVHDALYQFVPDGLPLRRAQCDRCFLELLRQDGFRLRGVYYLAVRLLGGLVRRGIRRVRQTQGTKIDLATAA